MRTYLLLLGVATSASAAFVFPDVVPLDKRQAPGTPQYDCHEDCGGVITQSRSEGFCDSSNFTSSLESCLDCANEFSIWQYYGESVAAAAEACGLDGTPRAGNATTAADGEPLSTKVPADSTTTGAAADATTTSEPSATEPTSDESPPSTSDGPAVATLTEGAASGLKPLGMLLFVALGASVAL